MTASRVAERDEGGERVSPLARRGGMPRSRRGGPRPAQAGPRAAIGKRKVTARPRPGAPAGGPRSGARRPRPQSPTGVWRAGGSGARPGAGGAPEPVSAAELPRFDWTRARPALDAGLVWLRGRRVELTWGGLGLVAGLLLFAALGREAPPPAPPAAQSAPPAPAVAAPAYRPPAEAPAYGQPRTGYWPQPVGPAQPVPGAAAPRMEDYRPLDSREAQRAAEASAAWGALPPRGLPGPTGAYYPPGQGPSAWGAGSEYGGQGWGPPAQGAWSEGPTERAWGRADGRRDRDQGRTSGDGRQPAPYAGAPGGAYGPAPGYGGAPAWPGQAW
jgi:hypothetical protein